MTRVLVVPPFGKGFTADIGRGAEKHLTEIGAHVDGYIEPLSGADGTWTAFVNEEGSMLDLPPNLQASVLVGGLGWAPAQGWTRHPLRGTVVLTGGPDEDGEITDVPEAVLDRAAAAGWLNAEPPA